MKYYALITDNYDYDYVINNFVSSRCSNETDNNGTRNSKVHVISEISIDFVWLFAYEKSCKP